MFENSIQKSFDGVMFSSQLHHLLLVSSRTEETNRAIWRRVMKFTWNGMDVEWWNVLKVLMIETSITELFHCLNHLKT